MTTQLFSSRTREAWGYADALADLHADRVASWRRGPKDLHFDPAYVRGYYRGMDAFKAQPRPVTG